MVDNTQPTRRASAMIDNLYDKGVKDASIILAVQREVGLGERFVKRRLELLREMNTK